MKYLFTTLTLFVLTVAVTAQQKPVIQQAKYFRKTIPLRDMEKQIGPKDQGWKDNVIRNEVNPKTSRPKSMNALPKGNDPVVQDYMGNIMQARDVTQNFDGVGNVNGVFPPDTEGDVGPNHYYQMINLSFAIYDKEGNKLYGPVNNSTLWEGFIGPWTGTNDGDPIVLYDEEADRWMASQFAINTSNNTYWELIAISETGDPTGSYYQYAFQFPAFNDYPKFGVWHDAYYATFNMFGSYNRAAAAAFERDKMLQGDSTARMVLFDMPASSDAFNMLPADFDGAAPPSTSPNYFIYFNDDYWGYPDDQLRIWEFEVDWTDPDNSTFQEVKTVVTEAFDSFLCDAPRSRCIPQPNTNTKLEAISDRLMYRLQYRNFGTYQTMVTNHTVDVANGQAGVRWYELRNNNDGNGWYIYQQGTYAPDGENRWMGSVAMNSKGNIALGYTVSSDSTYPSIRYTGRTANATLGEMNLQEVELICGTSSQYNYSRWGDYSCMSVDPVDDSTFWYTQEYMGGAWKTRIASFNFDPVGPVSSEAGPDDYACEDTAYRTDGSGENYNSVKWTTNGTGTLGNPQQLKATYIRSQQDLENGSVELYMTAYGYYPGEEDTDTMLLSFTYLPEVFPGNDTLLCVGESMQLNGIVSNSDSVLWTTSGDGTFDHDTSLTAIYTPGAEDLANGGVDLLLTGFPEPPCNDAVSELMTVTIDECTGLFENLPDIGQIKIIPNPNDGSFRYEMGAGAEKQIKLEIYNSSGSKIYERHDQSVAGRFTGKINLETSGGLYYLKVISSKGVKLEKLLIR